MALIYNGLNTLNIGYYLLIGIIVWYLKLDYQLNLNDIQINLFLVLLLLVFIMNSFNMLYLGDLILFNWIHFFNFFNKFI